MPSKVSTTTVTEAWQEGEWGGPMTLTDLEKFVTDARAAGFGDYDRITVHQSIILTSIKMRKVETS